MVAPANVKPPSDAPSADEVRSKKEAAAAKQKADLSLLEKESARVEKKLRLSATETIAAVDGMIADVRRAREKLTNVKRVDNTGTSVKQVLVDLVYQFPGLDKYPERVSLQSGHVKDLHACVGKLGKAVDASFPGSEYAQGPEWNHALDDTLICDAIAGHCYREGRVALAEAFTKKGKTLSSVAGAGTSNGFKGFSVRATADHAELQSILHAIDSHDLDKLFSWIDRNRKAMMSASKAGLALPESQGQPFYDIGEDLEYNARAVACGALLTQGDAMGALGLIRKITLQSNFERDEGVSFSGDEIEVRNLLGACAYATGPGALQGSAFADTDAFTSENGSLQVSLSNGFINTFWASKNKPEQSPLLVTVNAGCIAIPSLVKLSKALSVKGETLDDFRVHVTSFKQLPVDLSLPDEFNFLSTFACPVARDAISSDPTSEDYPLLLPCGLILSLNSITKMGTQRVVSPRGLSLPLGNFKCPYCPEIYTPDQCKRVYF